MKQVVLIGCTKRKNRNAAIASELYGASDSFRKKMEFAARKYPGCPVLILSAKYHAIDPGAPVRYYDLTLNNMPAARRKEWAAAVMDQLKGSFNLNDTEFIILAGRKYYEFLNLPHVEIPLAGMPIGKQKAYLNRVLGKAR